MSYSTYDVSRILGIPRERLKDWINHDYIYPSIHKAKGKGTSNAFSQWDLYGIALFEKLLWLGLSRESACKFYYSWSYKQTRWSPKTLMISYKYLVCLIPNKPLKKKPITKIVLVMELNMDNIIKKSSNWISVQVINVSELICEVNKTLLGKK